MTAPDLDIVVAELFEDMGIERQTARESIAFLCEEVGELAKATRTGDRKNLREEIGDVGILLVRIAHLSGIDLEDAIRAKVSERLARHRAEQVKKSLTPHPAEDVCCWCATDDQYADALEGRPHPIIHNAIDQAACPRMANQEERS